MVLHEEAGSQLFCVPSHHAKDTPEGAHVTRLASVLLGAPPPHTHTPGLQKLRGSLAAEENVVGGLMNRTPDVWGDMLPGGCSEPEWGL